MDKNSKQQIIGSTTVVDFPDFGVVNIPAKVDTGADSSAVWVSRVSERDGKLSFVLFDPSSPHYTGKVIEVEDYTIRSVKNSFGHAELRYKVPMRISLGGKRIKARLSLADRKNSRYPILIGRRSLQDRFLVDVAKVHESRASSEVPKVLVLVPYGRTQTFEFYDEINSLYADHLKIDLITYDQLGFKIENNEVNVSVGLEGRGLGDYKLIFFKNVMRNLEQAALLYKCASRLGISVVNSAARLAPMNDKLHQNASMAMNGISVPDSIYLSLEQLKDNFSEIKKSLGVPFVLKDLHGLGGSNNYLIRTKRQFIQACDDALRHDLQLLAQKYIDNDGDYRVLVFGKTIRMVIKRTGNKSETHLNNVSAGAIAEIVPTNALPGDVQKTCINAAAMMEWQVAGVDIIQDKKSGKWYCLEVNSMPQMVGGSFVEEKMQALAAYLKWEAGK